MATKSNGRPRLTLADYSVKFTLTKCGYFKSKRAVSSWTKHRQTSLLIPGHDPPLYMTIYLDIAINPGPDAAHELLLLKNRTGVNLHRVLTPKPIQEINSSRFDVFTELLFLVEFSLT